MRRFLRAPDACTQPGNSILTDLIYGWGNAGWSALDEYLAACIGHALTSGGPFLECGSGLTTILVGAIAEKRGIHHWALEHTTEWASKVQSQLKRYKFESVVLCTTPLKDHGDYCWYDAPLELMPTSFSLVVCDGPPGATKGGRYGLVPVMRERLRPGCVIVLDDAGREQELAIARRWEAELDASLELRGSRKAFIEITVGGVDRTADNPCRAG